MPKHLTNLSSLFSAHDVMRCLMNVCGWIHQEYSLSFSCFCKHLDFVEQSFSCAFRLLVLPHLGFYLQLSSNAFSPRACPRIEKASSQPSIPFCSISLFFVFFIELVNIRHYSFVHLFACLSPLEWKLPENKSVPSDKREPGP